MILLRVLFAGLAGYRLARMAVEEEGPGGIFHRIRQWAGVPQVGIQTPKPLIGGLLSCVFCLSVWVASIAYVLPLRVTGLLASWGVAAFLASQERE